MAGQVVQGDLGVSIQGNRAVTSTIADRLGVTIFLSLMSTVLVLGLGVPLGAVAAFRRGTQLDRAVVMFGVFGISSPAFVTGIFLLYVFGLCYTGSRSSVRGTDSSTVPGI